MLPAHIQKIVDEWWAIENYTDHTVAISNSLIERKSVDGLVHRILATQDREREAWFDGANSGNSYGWEAKSGESFPDYCERVFADFLATKKGDKG